MAIWVKYVQRAEPDVQVGAFLDDRTLWVEDEGEPFDPSASVVPETLEDTLSGKREGGMGLFVMRHLLSSLAYTQAGNKNIVTLRVSN